MSVNHRKRCWSPSWIQPSLVWTVFFLALFRCVVFFLLHQPFHQNYPNSLMHARNWAPSRLGISPDASHLFFWIRRDSFQNLQENIFRMRLGERLAKRQPRDVPWLPNASSLGLQAAYSSSDVDLPPLVLSLLKHIPQNPSWLLCFNFLGGLMTDILCCVLFCRTLSGIKAQCQSADESGGLLVGNGEVKDHVSCDRLLTFKNVSTEKPIGPHVYNDSPCLNGFLTCHHFIIVWMMNPFLIWSVNHLFLSSLRSLCLIASVSFSLFPSSLPPYNLISPAAISLYLYLSPTFNGLAAVVVLGATSCYSSSKDKLDGEACGNIFRFNVHHERNTKLPWKRLCEFKDYVLMTIASLGVLWGVSYWLCGYSFIFWKPSVMNVMLAEDLTPNLSVYWYLKQLIFPSHEVWYFLIYNLISTLLIFSCWLKFYRFPLTALQVMCGVLLLFQPYCGGSDYYLLYCFLLLDYPVVQKIKNSGSLLGLSVLVSAALWAKTFMWISKYTENPNLPYLLQLMLVALTSYGLIQFVRQAIVWRLREDPVGQVGKKKSD